MALLTEYSDIRISRLSVPPIIPAVQGDTGRQLVFTPTDYTIPADCTATYYIQKPSGNAVYNNATIEDGKVICDLTAQALAENGDNYGQIRIMKDEEVVTSFDFVLLVKPFRGIDAIESTTEMNIFDKAVEQAEEAIEAAAQEAEEYISQAIDATLTIEGKAADAKATGDAIDEVKNLLASEFTFEFEQGTISSAVGSKGNSNYRIRTIDFNSVEAFKELVFDSALQANFCWYKLAAHGYDSYLSQTGFLPSPISIDDVIVTDAAYFKLVVKYASGNSVQITPSDVTNSMIYGVSSRFNDIEEEIAELKAPHVPFTDEIQTVCDIKKSWEVGSSASGSCFATKNGVTQQWTFNVGADDNLTDAAWYRRVFDPETLEFASSSTSGRHSLGHVNSCSYNTAKDAFICGNGSGDYTLAGKIYLIEEAFDKTNFLIADALVIDFATYGTKVNAIWGDDNNGLNNIIYVITNDGYDIYRVMLGEDDTQLESGTLQKTTGFNGTYKVLQHWEYSTTKEDYANVVQGAFYHDGRVVWGYGHRTGVIPIHWVKLLNDSVETGGIAYQTYDSAGDAIARSICSAANIGDMTFCIYSSNVYMIDI